MDPMKRKLFQSRDARDKLRAQGGITASFPKLAETVAKFANGGPTELQIPRVRSAIQEGGMSYPSYRMLNRSQKRELGYPVSEIGGQLAFDRFGVGFGLVDPTDRFSPSGLNVSQVRPDTTGTGENMPRSSTGRNVPRNRPMTAEEAWAASNEFAGLPDQPSQDQQTVTPPEEEPSRIAEDVREALRLTDTSGEEPAAPTEEPTDTTGEEPAASTDPARTGAAIGAGDFDTTFDQMLSRLEGIMGEDSDEDKKKKAMANLAMIGLAIAAGQSPDALTNIAQGALIGMKGIQEAEAAKASDKRELKLMALKMAADEVDLRRRLQSQEKIAAMRASGGTGTYTPERLYQQNLDAILRNPDMFDVFTGDAVDPVKARGLAQQLSERGMTVGGAGGAGGSSQFTPGQQVIQNGVTYEYQEDGTWKPVGE